jgi:hypothetical protein
MRTNCSIDLDRPQSVQILGAPRGYGFGPGFTKRAPSWYAMLRPVQDIGIVSSRAPTVSRPAGARYVYLTFEGLRDSRTVADKQTRMHVALPVSEVGRLRELLAEAIDQVEQ